MSDSPQPVRPRDAASLVIHRRGERGLEVLLGQRPTKARFKPGIYVFPGGMLEPADARVQPYSPLDPTIHAKLAVGASAVRGNALALAAIRETFEECGLMVGQPGDIGDNPLPSWQVFRQCGLAPPLGKLRYLGRAITPSVQPIRFHARFFAVAAEHVAGVAQDSGELGHIQWVPLSAVRELAVMPVTLLMLEALLRQLEQADPRAAFLSFQRGQRQILWV